MGSSARRMARILACAASACLATAATAALPMAAGTGAATYVVRNDGTAWVFGINSGDVSYLPTPLLIEGNLAPLRNVTSIAAGTSHTVAVAGGSLYVWGFNGNGELGTGDTASVSRPRFRSHGCAGSVVAVAAGAAHSLALCSEGTVRSWGSNGTGQLGINVAGASQLTPQTVVGVGGAGTLGNVVAIAAGGSASYALLGDGTVVAWGFNGAGQLGDATTTQRNAPVAVKNVGGAGQLANVTHLAAAFRHAVARRSDGSVVAWGDNAYGQLGVGSTAGPYTSPTPVQGVGGGGTLAGVRSIAAGGFATSYAITDSGRLLAWGSNAEGMVGDGTITNRTTPFDTGLEGVAVVGPNFSNCTNCNHHVVAVTGYGVTFSWGDNSYGQLGIGYAFSGSRTIPGLVNSRDPAVPFFAKVGTDAQQPRADATGDLRSDVIWTEPSTGGLYLWAMDGRGVFPQPLGTVGGGWALAGSGDLDFDGFADLLWRHSDGSMYAWFMEGPVVRGHGFLPGVDPAWSILAVNDFTGEGSADILLRRASDGAMVIWQMAGLSLARVINAGTLSAATWSLAASGDLNGDGRADMLWRDAAGGFYAWITGTPNSITGSLSLLDQGALPNPGLEWTVAAAADVDGDGKADIVFRRPSDGANYLWRMNGKALASQAALPFVGPEWSIATVGDFNGDGRNDLFFRRGDGVNYLWLMNDATIIDQGTLPSVGPTWSVVSPK